MVVTIKKGKGTKKCVTKRQFKFENYKDCLEPNDLDNKTNYLEKKIKKELKRKIIHRNNTLILKTQQRSRGEKHDVY